MISGCAGSYYDVMDNRFIETVKMPPPVDYIGLWSGTYGPMILTFKIESDGSGIVCSSQSNSNTIYKMKYNNKNLYFQNGGNVALELSVNSLIAIYPWLLGAQPKVKMLRDNLLENAAPFCQENMLN